MIAELVFVAALLVIAVVLRERWQWLAAARIPASLVAGLIGLVLLQAGEWGEESVPIENWARVSDSMSETLRQWPGTLIAVVFAGMLLAKSGPRRTFNADNLRRVARQGLMVWIIVLGQTAVGLWVTFLLIQPFYDLPNSVGMLIETGFAGGHGTAAAMGVVFAHPVVGLEEGLDLGLLMATAGLVYGLVSGVLLINIAVRRGWFSPGTGSTTGELRPQSIDHERSSQPESETSIGALGPRLGRSRISGETIDPLLLQLIWIVLAFAMGLGLQSLMGSTANAIESLVMGPAEATTPDESGLLRERVSIGGVVGSFPLFIYTLFGGAIVRWLITLVGQKERIDSDTIHRIVATSMDVLVVSAVATLNLTAVASLWFPFAALFVAASVWCTFCWLVLSRWILPRPIWFQLGLINYGMSTGTTATGFVMLRTIDPELRSGAAEDYALAAPLSAPFIGGGMITVALPLLVLERVPVWVSASAISLVVLALIAIGIRVAKRAEDGDTDPTS